LDVELTGGEGKMKRKKLTRVFPIGDAEGGTWTLALDPTFDDTW
jgi:hypothetical protein